MTFFEQYSYKQKNYALLLIAVLLVAVSYKRAFKITLETLGYKQELTQKIADAHHAVSSIRTTQRDIAYLNKLLGKENSTIEKVQQGFLDFLEKNSSNVIVYQVDEVLNYKHPDFSVNTHRIILKGGFLPTLRFLYTLEKHFDLAKLVNVSFEFKKYNSEEKEQLYTTLLLQNYER
jgi:cellobiose phosphorylase